MTLLFIFHLYKYIATPIKPIIIINIEYLLIINPIISMLSETIYPALIKTLFHIYFPKLEYIVNVPTFILITPAIIDINVLASGISLDNNTDILSYFCKK